MSQGEELCLSSAAVDTQPCGNKTCPHECVSLYNQRMQCLIWIGLFIGSTLGSYLPTFWGAGVFSFSSLFGSALGAIIGIWLGYKVGQLLGV